VTENEKSKQKNEGGTGEAVATESGGAEEQEKTAAESGADENITEYEAASKDSDTGGEDQAVSEVIDQINSKDDNIDSDAVGNNLQSPGGVRPAGEIVSDGNNIDLLMDVKVTVRVELGRTRKTIEDILQLSPGMLIELERNAGDSVDLYLNDKLFATGEVTVVGGNFAIKIDNLVSRNERLRATTL
jgi:flagellar motor switch protein FliN